MQNCRWQAISSAVLPFIQFYSIFVLVHILLPWLRKIIFRFRRRRRRCRRHHHQHIDMYYCCEVYASPLYYIENMAFQWVPSSHSLIRIVTMPQLPVNTSETITADRKPLFLFNLPYDLANMHSRYICIYMVRVTFITIYTIPMPIFHCRNLLKRMCLSSVSVTLVSITHTALRKVILSLPTNHKNWT